MLIVRKAKKKIVRSDGMHEAWVYQSPALPIIVFKDVVKECAEACGEHPSKTIGVVTALMDRIANYLDDRFSLLYAELRPYTRLQDLNSASQF